MKAQDITRESLPRTALLVIEVADTSLRKDRGFKAALYTRFGIPEYWIVNVQESTVPGVTISLSELFA